MSAEGEYQSTGGSLRTKAAIHVVLLLAAHFPVFAQDEFQCTGQVAGAQQKQILTQVEERYAKFSDLKAKFMQRSYFAGLDQRVESSGKVSFKKPGMMDWVYEEPDKQRFVADGENLWFHQPDLNQVTVGGFKQAFNSDLPVSFLLGVGRLQENFKLQSACRSAAGIILELLPVHADPNLRTFSLLIDREKFNPVGARVVDIAGNDTAIVFSDITLNPGLSSEQFAFDVPKGTDVIDNRGAAQPGQNMSPSRPSEAAQ